jgi:hypothetical protein
MVAVARQFHTQQNHYLRKAVNYNDTGIAAGVAMGSIPAGARILECRIYVDTAFNAATTNNLLVGTTAAGNDIVATGTSAAGTAGYKVSTTGNTLTFAADTPIYVAYTQTGTAATAGVAVIILTFVPNNDG